MAAAARAEYATGAVYGNVAYDLERVAGGYALPREREYDTPTPEELRRQRIEERLRAREDARAREKAQAQTFGVPMLGIVGMLVAAALVVFVIFGYVQLAQISGETARVKSSIADLEEQNVSLKIRCEAEFNLLDVESYAMNVLGMVKLTDDNMNVHTVVRQDKAEILAQDDTATFLSRLGGLFDSIMEYLG